MNTQKLFLFIAIFLTVFLLWDKWELTQSIDENGNVITETQIVGTSSSTEISDVPAPATFLLQATFLPPNYRFQMNQLQLSVNPATMVLSQQSLQIF